jgi:general secretion pathway protein A
MAIFSVSVLMFWFYKQGTAGTQLLVQRFIGRVHLSNPLQDKIKEGAGQQVQELVAPKSSQNILQGSEFEPLSDFLDDMDVKSARLFAMEAVLELWINDVNFDPSLHNEPLDDDFFQKAAEQNGFSMLRTECDTQLLISLNLPAIVAIQRPRSVSPGFLTLQAIDDHEVTLGRKGKNAVITVPMHVLNASCSGAVYIPWRNQMGEDDLIPGGQPDNSIMMLKQHLREIGYTQVGVGPFYDDQTEWAVQDLQEKYGLAPDGIVGPLTKIMILNENPNSQIPHIRRQLAKR